MITDYKRISKKTSNDEYDSLNENLNTQMQNQTKPFFYVGVHPLPRDLEIKLHLYIFHTFLQLVSMNKLLDPVPS